MTYDKQVFNLQLFGDGPAAGANPPAGAADPAAAGATPPAGVAAPAAAGANPPAGAAAPAAAGTTPPVTDPPAGKTYTDDEVNKIVNAKFARWQADQAKAVEDAKVEAAKLAKMSADQKQQYAMEKLQKENDALKEAAAKVELSRTAADLLKAQKIDATPDMLSLVVGADAEATKANVEKFAGIITAQLKAAEVARATGRTPPAYQGAGTPLSEIQQRIAKYK